jgi:hypothetical protein
MMATSDTLSDHATQMTSNSAQLAVFGTCELLEDILSYLPLKSLFVVQRVSRQWSGVISGSPVLQENMFLRLKSTAPKETWFSASTITFDHHHRLHSGGSVKVIQGDPTSFRRLENSSTTNKKLYMPTALNPVLQMSHPLQSTLQHLSDGKREAVSFRIRSSALNKRSSLWNMYISDPPCRKVRLKLPVEPKGGSQIKSDEGLKVGDVVAAAARFQDEHCFGPDRGPLWREIRESERDEITASLGGPLPNHSIHNAQSVYDIEFVTLCIDLLRDGTLQPMIPSEAERATMVFSFG